MEAKELFEWAIRAQVKNEMGIYGYEAVDFRLIAAVKMIAESSMASDCSSEALEGAIAVKEIIEEQAVKAVEVRPESAFARGFGFDPLKNFPSIR